MVLEKYIAEWAGRKRISQTPKEKYLTVCREEDGLAVLADVNGKIFKVPLKDKKLLFLTLDLLYAEWKLSSM